MERKSNSHDSNQIAWAQQWLYAYSFVTQQAL